MEEKKEEDSKEEFEIQDNEKNNKNISSQTLDEIEQSKEIENLRKLEAVFFFFF